MAANMFESLGVTDKYGTNIGKYQMMFDPGTFSFLSQLAAALTGIIYSLLVLPPSALATWIADRTSNPEKMFGGLANAWSKMVGPLYDLVPIQALVMLAVAIPLVVVGFSRKSTPYDAVRADFGRLVRAALIGALLVVVARNPIEPVMTCLDFVTSVMRDVFTTTNSNGEVNSNADVFLAPLTQISNFGSTLTDSCAASWSAALDAGGDSAPKCVGDVKNVSWNQLPAALAAAVVAILQLVFQIMAFALMYWHFLLTMVSVSILVYSAAVSLMRRHNYDLLSRNFAHTAANLIMLLIVALLSVAGPGAMTALSADILGEGRSGLAQTAGIIGMLFSQVIGYVLIIFVLYKLTSRTGALAKALRQGTNTKMTEWVGSPGTSWMEKLNLSGPGAASHDGAQNGALGTLAAFGLGGTGAVEKYAPEWLGGTKTKGGSPVNTGDVEKQDEEVMPNSDRAIAPQPQGDEDAALVDVPGSPQAMREYEEGSDDPNRYVDPDTGGLMTLDGDQSVPVTDESGSPIYVDPETEQQYTLGEDGAPEYIFTDDDRPVYADPNSGRTYWMSREYVPTEYVPEGYTSDAEHADVGDYAQEGSPAGDDEDTQTRVLDPVTGLPEETEPQEQTSGRHSAPETPAEGASGVAPEEPVGTPEGAPQPGTDDAPTSVVPVVNESAAPAGPAPTSAAGVYGSSVVAPGPSLHRAAAEHPGMGNYPVDPDAVTADLGRPEPKVQVPPTPAQDSNSWMWDDQDQLVLDGMESFTPDPLAQNMPEVHRTDVVAASSLTDPTAVASMDAAVLESRELSLASGGSGVVDLDPNTPQLELMFQQGPDGMNLVEPMHGGRLDGFVG